MSKRGGGRAFHARTSNPILIQKVRELLWNYSLHASNIKWLRGRIYRGMYGGLSFSFYLIPKLSDFSSFIESNILDSCFRRNDYCHPMNENVIPVKTGIQKGFIFK